MRDERRTNEQLKIELLSQWKLEAESRNISTALERLAQIYLFQDRSKAINRKTVAAVPACVGPAMIRVISLSH